MTVSYLVSSYNKAEYLPAVLRSIIRELAITGGDVLVIDDGSTDSSWAVIQELCRQDSRIAIRRQDNKGIFNVTNQLVKSAGQEWLRIVDCDDPPIIGSTALLKKIGEEERADYIFGRMLTYGPGPLSKEIALVQQSQPSSVEILPDPMTYAIRQYNHVPTTALIRRKSIPSTLHLNEKMISCQDLALALPIFAHARVVRIDSPVCHQLIGSQKRLSANEALTYFQTTQIIKEFGSTNFAPKYRYMAARKLVSRALKFMRHQKTAFISPLIYCRLVALYISLLMSKSVDWEHYLESAEQAYAQFVPANRRVY